MNVPVRGRVGHTTLALKGLGYKVTGIQGYRVTWLQGYKVTGLQRYSVLQGYKVTGLQGYKVTGLLLLYSPCVLSPQYLPCNI